MKKLLILAFMFLVSLNVSAQKNIYDVNNIGIKKQGEETYTKKYVKMRIVLDIDELKIRVYGKEMTLFTILSVSPEKFIKDVSYIEMECLVDYKDFCKMFLIRSSDGSYTLLADFIDFKIAYYLE
jgi:hypothetical protein